MKSRNTSELNVKELVFSIKEDIKSFKTEIKVQFKKLTIRLIVAQIVSAGIIIAALKIL